MTKQSPHSRSLRLHRKLAEPGIFHITKRILPSRDVLQYPERDLIVSAFRFSVERGRVQIGAFVVMLDHFHLLLSLLGGWTIDRFMHTLMSFVASRTGQRLRAAGCRWQDGYYEKEIRSCEQFNFVVDYLHWNPVRKGLVRSPEDWTHSSANRVNWVQLSWWD